MTEKRSPRRSVEAQAYPPTRAPRLSPHVERAFETLRAAIQAQQRVADLISRKKVQARAKLRLVKPKSA